MSPDESPLAAPISPERLRRIDASNRRWRTIFGALALVLPACSHAVFERQARRLDALGDHGEVAMATVTSIERANGGRFAHYRYEVGGARYTWNADAGELARGVGDTFPILYLPEDPELNVLGTERALAARRASEDRAFARKATAGIFAFFALSALLCHVQVKRVEAKGAAALAGPGELKRRLVVACAFLVPLLAGITWFHVDDARAKGEPLAPVLLATTVSIAVLGGTFAYVLRRGAGAARLEGAKLLRWAAPLAAAIAALRLMAWLWLP